MHENQFIAVIARLHLIVLVVQYAFIADEIGILLTQKYTLPAGRLIAKPAFRIPSIKIATVAGVAAFSPQTFTVA